MMGLEALGMASMLPDSVLQAESQAAQHVAFRSHLLQLAKWLGSSCDREERLDMFRLADSLEDHELVEQDASKIVASVFIVDVYVIAEPAVSDAMQVTKYDSGGKCKGRLACVMQLSLRHCECCCECC